jgi:hypothetical protein
VIEEMGRWLAGLVVGRCLAQLAVGCCNELHGAARTGLAGLGVLARKHCVLCTACHLWALLDTNNVC